MGVEAREAAHCWSLWKVDAASTFGSGHAFPVSCLERGISVHRSQEGMGRRRVLQGSVRAPSLSWDSGD